MTEKIHIEEFLMEHYSDALARRVEELAMNHGGWYPGCEDERALCEDPGSVVHEFVDYVQGTGLSGEWWRMTDGHMGAALKPLLHTFLTRPPVEDTQDDDVDMIDSDEEF